MKFGVQHIEKDKRFDSIIKSVYKTKKALGAGMQISRNGEYVRKKEMTKEENNVL